MKQAIKWCLNHIEWINLLRWLKFCSLIILQRFLLMKIKKIWQKYSTVYFLISFEKSIQIILSCFPFKFYSCLRLFNIKSNIILQEIDSYSNENRWQARLFISRLNLSKFWTLIWPTDPHLIFIWSSSDLHNLHFIIISLSLVS